MMKKEVELRPMEQKDYKKVHDLWISIKGFGIRSIDDSKEQIFKFLDRNPGLSVVAWDKEAIIGCILCGQDGRRGSFYHVCVRKDYRMHGVGHMMMEFCLKQLSLQGISKVSLVAFETNHIGNSFWKQCNWVKRDDLNYYEYNLNEENITIFME